jgi:hypothetical protein
MPALMELHCVWDGGRGGENMDAFRDIALLQLLCCVRLVAACVCARVTSASFQVGSVNCCGPHPTPLCCSLVDVCVPGVCRAFASC